MKRALATALIAGIVLPVPVVAVAETPESRARALNRRGMSKYDLGQYTDALDLFKRAYELFPEPKILFNLAQTYRKQRDYEKALDAYRSYLRGVPDAPNRPVVEERIKEIEQLVASQRASDGKPPEGVASAPDPRAPPGSGVVQAPTQSMTPDVPPTRRHWYGDPLGWTLVGSGILVVGLGAGMFAHAAGQKDELDSLPESMRDGRRDDIRRNQTIGAIGLGLGGALIASGVVRFVLVHGREAQHPPLEVGLAGGFLFAKGQF